jgi:hypothetical protein
MGMMSCEGLVGTWGCFFFVCFVGGGVWALFFPKTFFFETFFLLCLGFYIYCCGRYLTVDGFYRYESFLGQSGQRTI